MPASPPRPRWPARLRWPQAVRRACARSSASKGLRQSALAGEVLAGEFEQIALVEQGRLERAVLLRELRDLEARAGC